MKRFSEISVAAACFAALVVVAGCGDEGSGQQAPSPGAAMPAAALPKVTLKTGMAFPTSLALIGEGAITLADKVDRVSGGSLEIKLFEPGALVPALEAIQSVSKGSIDAAWSTAGYIAGTDVTFNFFTAVPFGPDAPEYLAWMYHGGGLELAEEMFAEHNVKYIPCAITPPEASGWFRKEIKSLDDLKGMKMRFFGLGARVMDKMGVATQLLAGGDIFQALQLGTIDSTEFAMPAMDESFGFYQVAKYYYFPGWHQPSSILALFVNMDLWNGLSDQHKAILEVTCGDMVRHVMAHGEAIQSPAMQRMRDDHDVKIKYWPPEFLEAYEKAWREVIAEESATNPQFRKVHASYSKFRKEFKLWGDNGYLKR
ncbi:MAG TPA: TRAP transporter substrate-binding protein [Burkholderiales bacterium]|nr:TRAP transporter substrate-binding protein [Burkholderiales bacterium]